MQSHLENFPNIIFSKIQKTLRIIDPFSMDFCVIYPSMTIIRVLQYCSIIYLFAALMTEPSVIYSPASYFLFARCDWNCVAAELSRGLAAGNSLVCIPATGALHSQGAHNCIFTLIINCEVAFPVRYDAILTFSAIEYYCDMPDILKVRIISRSQIPGYNSDHYIPVWNTGI
jgi:hypothetical protein